MRIIQANKELYKKEAKYYDRIHSEIFNRKEQRRINVLLRANITKGDKALDVGAGTGNITLKLRMLGYRVTAIEPSKELANILNDKYKDIKIINKDVDSIKFKEKFDLITIYSVLHHLPDPYKTLDKLCKLLKKDGIIYIDHECSPYFWYNKNKWWYRLYQFINGCLNVLYIRLKYGIKRKDIKFDYSQADYHTKDDDHIEADKVWDILKKNCSIKLVLYRLNMTHLWNPLKYFIGKDTMMFIGKNE